MYISKKMEVGREETGEKGSEGESDLKNVGFQGRFRSLELLLKPRCKPRVTSALG